MPKQKTIGLALGGGGVRGLAHIGVLEVLEEAGIKVDYVAGTSMGGIIGGLFALGKTPKELRAYTKKMGNTDLSKTGLNIWNESLIKPDRIHKMFKLMFKNKRFEDCDIPFRCTAVDIEAGKEFIFKEGPLIPAVQASSALPFILPATFYEGRVFVDGGILNNVPLSLLDEFKPDITIGIQITSFASRQDISGAIFRHYYAPQYQSILKRPNFFRRIRNNLDLMMNIIMRSFEVATNQTTLHQIKDAKPDLLLNPHLEMHLLDFKQSEEAIEVGRESMKAVLPKLKKLLAKE